MTLAKDLCYSIVDLQLLLENYESYTSSLRYFNVVMSIVTCLVGLVGNAVVIGFIGLILKKHKTKYWFLNLAIADFLALLTLPLHAISTLKGTWTFGPEMCKLYLFSICADMYISIYSLLALNIARVLSVAHPMFHLKFISQRVSVWICTSIWFCIPLLTLPMFFYCGELNIGEVTLCYYLGSNINDKVNVTSVSSGNATRDIFYKFSPYIEQCSSDTCCGGEETLSFWNHLIFKSTWILTPFLIIGYFIPLVVVVICNITLAVQVRKSKTINTHRLYRFLFMITIMFFITWTPVVMAETMLFNAVLSMDLRIMVNILAFMPLFITIAYTHSCLNPIVYVLTGERMRTELSDFISSIRNN